MTDKEKLEKIKKLADAMYYAAFNLTTDASLLRKAMKEYRQFIIHEYHKEEPVSEEWIEELTTKLDSLSKEDFKKVFDKYAVDFNEEHTSDELEEAANEWNARASFTPFYMALDDNGRPNGVRRSYTTHAESFKAGAKWQKQKQKDSMLVSEELEDACKQLAENARKHKAETSSPFFSQTDYIQGVMDGVKWAERKTQKK